MANDLKGRLDELERRIARLEYRDTYTLPILRKRFNDPLSFFVLEYDLGDKQLTGVCEVMETVHQALKRGEQTEEADFEKQLSPHIPQKWELGGSNGYLFIQALLRTFSRTGQWSNVVEHFDRRGDYNLRLDLPD
jgi:hypothetical protein